MTSSKRTQTITVDGRVYRLTSQQLEALGAFRRLDNPATSLDMIVLSNVCENRRSFSSTTLLADITAPGANQTMTVEALQWILEGLNKEGWVIYRLGHYGIFTDIRATNLGYLIAGYPPPAMVILGKNRHHGSDSPRHPGDMTDFRNHHKAFWENFKDLERMSAIDHIRKYPSHHHEFAFEDQEQLHSLRTNYGVASSAPQAHNGGSTAPPGGEAEGEPVVAIPTPAQEARRLIVAGDTVTEIRNKTGLGVGTIYKMKSDPYYMPSEANTARARKAAVTNKAKGGKHGGKVSLEARIHEVLLNAEKPLDVPELAERIRRDGRPQTAASVSEHRIVHVLFMMRRRNVIEMEGSGNRSASSKLTKIRLFGKRWGQPESNERVVAPAAPPPERAPQSAETAPAAVAVPAPAPAPSPAPALAPRWPLLSALVQRRHKAGAAIRLLREAGMNDAADLIADTPLDGSPLEQEILDLVQWVDSHGGNQPLEFIIKDKKKE